MNSRKLTKKQLVGVLSEYNPIFQSATLRFGPLKLNGFVPDATPTNEKRLALETGKKKKVTLYLMQLKSINAHTKKKEINQIDSIHIQITGKLERINGTDLLIDCGFPIWTSKEKDHEYETKKYYTMEGRLDIFFA